jgi:hypothetical protein
MQTHNLVATNKSFSAVHTQDTLKQFNTRHKFAKQQKLSEHVTCTSIYTDDADICFMFNVVHKNKTYTVDIYANYKNDYVSGNVYNCKYYATAIKILQQHFNLRVNYAQLYDNDMYFNAK